LVALALTKGGVRSPGETSLIMTETEFTIGAVATCTDGVCGEVSRVVVDPVARAVTHLVIEPRHSEGLGRLVPLDLVDATTGEVRLRCTLAEFEKLDHADATEFVPEGGGHPGWGGLATGVGIGNAPQPITYDTLPPGKVAVRRGEQVHATDGDIGHVQGLGIDSDRRVTYVILREGHLRGRKEVAIPISAIVGVDDGIRLNITKEEVKNLPPVDVEHPDG